MTLSFREIGLRFPDAVVYWDRDVATTLDWEPRFVERDGVLWADCIADHRSGQHRHGRFISCRCLVWRDRWVTYVEWRERRQQQHRVLQTSRDLQRGRVILSGSRGVGHSWFDEARNFSRNDMADAIAYAAEHIWRQGLPRHRRWPTLRRVLGRNQPR